MDTAAQHHDTASPTDGHCGARTYSGQYPVWLCDLWGVVHNGEAAFAKACHALAAHRDNGGTVILITNAPRPSSAITPQLRALGVGEECFDAIVSSGDATRHLVSQHTGRNVHHLGPPKDFALLDGLPVNFTTADDAEVILCSGLLDDENETPEDYRDILEGFRSRDLPMICANPDKVVRKGERLIPCGGALAQIYEQMGGEVAMAGKPYPPIYDECLRLASLHRGAPADKRQVLAIGDGLSTDVAGAAGYGLTLLFIVNGIHEFELAKRGPAAIEAAIHEAAPHTSLAGFMRGLQW